MTGSSVVLFGVKKSFLEKVKSQPQALDFQSFSGPQETPAFFEFLKGNKDRIAVIVLGDKVQDPVQMAQRIRVIDQKISVIVLGQESSFAQLKRAFQFATHVGDQINCILEDTSLDLNQVLLQAVDRTEKRKKYLQLVSSSQQRLKNSRPPEDLSPHSYFDRLPDFAPIGITALNKDGFIVAWNRKAADITGHQEREVLGIEFSDFLSASGREGFKKSLAQAVDGTEIAREVYSFDPSFGGRETERYFEIIFGPLTGPLSGKGAMVLFQDISERIQSEKDLENARIAAEAASTAKSQFLANMSHEIRTPLGAIMGFVSLLKEGYLSPEESKGFLTIIERNSNQLLRIIDDILDLSKVEAGMMTIEHIPFSLVELLTDFSSLLGFRAREKGIRFEISAKTPLPEIIISDPTRIRQILANIVGNAVKFTEKGVVELKASFIDGKIEFEVTDTGRGIPAHQTEILFQAFSQGDPSMTRKYGGTGLGLILTKKLSEALGGTFSLKESQVGVGSTFVATIDAEVPAGSKMTQVLGALSSPVLAAQTGGRLAGMQILLVEDSPDNQAIISRFLNRAGAQVDIAANGSQGLTMALEKTYDALVMDIQMPVMDGITATKELRSRNCQTPIIALTAHAMKEERERCLRAGFTAFLSKPVQRDALISLLETHKRQKPLTP